jgi:hypothetical protein
MISTVLRLSAVGSKVYPHFAAHIAEQRFCPCIPTAHRTSPNISSRAVRCGEWRCVVGGSKQVRSGLFAGGRWIRTRFLVASVKGDRTAVSKTGVDLMGDRKFESISLHRRV